MSSCKDLTQHRAIAIALVAWCYVLGAFALCHRKELERALDPPPRQAPERHITF